MPRLLDGTRVSSYAEAWRHECEARDILALPTLDARRDRLTGIRHHRGAAEVERLQATMLALHRARRTAKLAA